MAWALLRADWQTYPRDETQTGDDIRMISIFARALRRDASSFRFKTKSKHHGNDL
jgi:hypothetical protein